MKKFINTFVVLVIVLIEGSVFASVPEDYTLMFEDEFTGGALNTSVWQYREGNIQKSYSRRENVSVSDGILKIECKTEDYRDKNYTVGGIVTREYYSYGYYEAKMKIPSKPGWHSSFWSSYYAGDSWEEVDFAETDSDRLYQYGPNYHCWYGKLSSLPPHKQLLPPKVKTPDLSADFHVFGCLYTPAGLIYYFDGAEVGRADNSQFPEWKANIYLTAATIDSAVVEATSIPQIFYVDWVRYYTPPVNYIRNPNFDAGLTLTDWTAYGNRNACKVEKTYSAKSLDNRLYFDSQTPYITGVKQVITNIPNGKYTLRAMAQSSNGQVNMTVNNGTVTRGRFFPAGSTWKKIEINDITVTNQTCTVSFVTCGLSNQWASVDNIELISE